MGRYYRQYRARADDHKLTFRLCAGVFALVISAMVFMIVNGQFEKLWLVTWANIPVWIIMSIIACWGIFWCAVHKEMNWVELLFYLVICVPMTIPFCMIGYWFTTGLYASECINGYVHSGEYYEEYTTETTTTEDDGNETTTTTYHPPEWYLLSSAVLHGNRQQVSCTRADYERYVSKFDNEQFHALYHANQSSSGDGNMYSTTWDGSVATKTPMATAHPYVNYIKASESMKQWHKSVCSEGALFREYPQIRRGPSGPIELNRVIPAGVTLPKGWANVNTLLAEELMTLGAERECNIIVYVVATADRGFRHQLEGYWTGGNKNDIIVIIGAEKFPIISWVDVISMSKDKLFNIELRDRLEERRTLNMSANEFVGIITSQIRKPKGQGGFDRESMEAFSYLAYEIRLPFWATFLLIVFDLLCTAPFMYFFLTNDFSDEDTDILNLGDST